MSFPNEGEATKTQQLPCSGSLPKSSEQYVLDLAQQQRGGGRSKDGDVTSHLSCKTRDTSPWGNQH